MRGKSVLVIAACVVVAARAEAASTVAIAPPPAWVTRPQAPPVAPAGRAPEAIRAIVNDLQVRVDRGVVESYHRTMVEVGTPEGLPALSTLSLGWRPDVESLTVHWLRIVRGGQIIDLLAGGPGFTVLRRETNLERAMLDGALTAAIQPEGLQVGDRLDLAATIVQRDPALAALAEYTSPPLLFAPVDQLRVRVSWPRALPLRTRLGRALPKAVRGGDATTATLEIATAPVVAVKFPRGAPARFADISAIELTAADDWTPVVAVMRPLFATAARIAPSGPLAGEVAKIAAASTDPVARTEAALRLVEDRVRYVYLGMNQGNYLPASADETWRRRFGDCKAKTALLVAVLTALGVDAVPALASTTRGDGLDGRLPLATQFDHVIVRVTIAGRAHWLDGTRSGDRALSGLETPNVHWALPLDGAATLVRLVATAPSTPYESRSLDLDASQGLDHSAAARAEHIYRGDAAVGTRLAFAGIPATNRDQALREFWRGHYDWIAIDTVVARFDEDRRETVLTMTGKANMGWRGWAGGNRRRYRADGGAIGYRPNFDRVPESDARAPFANDFPAFVEARETVVLPGTGFTVVGADVDRTIAGVAYRRRAAIDGRVFTVTASTKTLAAEFTAVQATDAAEPLRVLADDPVYLLAPVAYGRKE